ncbi:ATP-binding protein [Pseudoalteromonas sp. L23]|uniref:AAA family ATPase n=1 Tax=unclassified Pseudoalteromonas TaxID=194690 RepID=UPI001EF08065|nr:MULTISPECIES: AAA family ATPase [unclassified Pseudoalteromonas]MCF7516537.1 ATP-binding protein [Pseudoalteromonas sp. L7]MCF7528585.1 ATP-binding protein [Pseudoalteromonas sp. L23]
MLAKFCVTNFKAFSSRYEFDLTKTSKYEFNKECVKNSIVNKALVYGHNGVGKSNLGFAIFELVSHLTDRQCSSSLYKNFLNATCSSKTADFEYTFIFGDSVLNYNYSKSDPETLVKEEIIINGTLFAKIDRNKTTVSEINADGAESLKTDLGDSKVSIASYIKNNTVLEKNERNGVFHKFLDFVNGMLFFRSLNRNQYIGLEQGSTKISSDIIDKNKVSEFEEFLNSSGIKAKLCVLDSEDGKELGFDFGKKKIPFYDIASQGTQSLSLFYFWYLRLIKDTRVTFLFVDEYDAFYHHDLASSVITKLKEVAAQTIITTHNTSVMSNDLLRPDCYFLMHENSIHSLVNSTDKDLREAHNIEKMYKAGAFNA